MNEEKLYSFLGLIQKSGNLVSGYNNCISEIKKDKCKLVIISEDASENTKKKFIIICDNRKIPCIIWGNKDRIGLSIGKSQKSVMAVRNENMSKVVLGMFE